MGFVHAVALSFLLERAVFRWAVELVWQEP